MVTTMAAATDLQFEDLKILLQASDKETVIGICNDLMQSFDYKIGNMQTKSIARALNIEKEQSTKLHTALGRLLKRALFLDTQDPEILFNLFPANFHNNLKELLVKIILDNQSTWRKQAISNQVSMPRLVDFDWRVDLKAASGTISRLSVPTCLVQFKVQNIPIKVGVVPEEDLINMELSKETLDTMLNGLYKIQDQLSSIAKKE